MHIVVFGLREACGLYRAAAILSERRNVTSVAPCLVFDVSNCETVFYA